MSKILIENIVLDESENRVFSDMASILYHYPNFRVKNKSGKFISIFSRRAKYQKNRMLGTQKKVLEMFKNYTKWAKISHYKDFIREAEAIIVKYGA